MLSLAIASLSIRGFRNLGAVDLELSGGLNVFWGNNGQGKTNLLEAVYVLATSQSFRTSRLRDLVGLDEGMASIRGTIREGATDREQSVGLRPGVRLVRIEGRRPETLASYAIRTPTVVFHPGVVGLSAGGGTERRKLLDRIALYRAPSSLAEVEAYRRAARARQRVLETRGDKAADIGEWEALMARHGMAIVAAREGAAALLCPSAERAFGRIGSAEVRLRVAYVPNAPCDEAAFRACLADTRDRDRARGSATWGPHRDELSLELGGRSVRGLASQGQHRAVVLALQLAEIEIIGETRGLRPLLLLDDVSSELDRSRTDALFAALRAQAGQVLLTTTRPELIEIGATATLDSRKEFAVVAGAVQAH
jgi:DNA replication and repair protein RecF